MQVYSINIGEQLDTGTVTWDFKIPALTLVVSNTNATWTIDWTRNATIINKVWHLPNYFS